MKTLVIFLALAGVCFSAEAFKPVPFTNVKFEDTFWKPRLETNQKVSIPHNYKWCEETGRFDNFAKAAGLMEGEFRGIYFNDSDVYKVLEGTAYSLASNPDPELEKAADKVIDWIAAAQLPNGYINSYYQLKEPDKKWTNTPVMHELYCIGHKIEAAVAYKQATGKTKLLEVAEKAVAHVADTFGYEEGKKREVPGHQEIELALVKLYDLTGKEKYLDLARMFIDIRGDLSKRTDRLQGLYSQDHKPVREQDEVVGHSVRAMYLYCGMTDIAAKGDGEWRIPTTRLAGTTFMDIAPQPGDGGLVIALAKLWNSVVNRKMYITGGIGARHAGEAFGEDYELPNRTAYCETCAAIGLVFWAHRMNLLHGNAKYADVVERALYNGVLAGIGMDGKSFFYVNPLESVGNHHRQPFFDCACCPTNVIRFISSAPGYVYATQGNTIIVNQYVTGEATIQLPDGVVTIKQETNYPWDGKLKFTFESVPNENAAKEFVMNFRIPKWSDGVGRSYIDPVPVKWGEKFVQTLGFPMVPKRMVAHPKVVANQGRVAIQRGPLIYCFEQCDNEVPVQQILLAGTPGFREEFRSDLLGGIMVLKCKNADGRELTAIPYYAWDHREAGPMAVWVRQEGLPRRPQNLDDPAWNDLLYRELQPEMLSGDTESLSLYETTVVTASHCWGSDTPDAVFDEMEPKSSFDRTIPRLTWWDHKGTNEWVALAFETPQKISEVGVYWFDDEPQGGCRIPESWSLSYNSGGADWIPIQTTYEVKKDAYCTAKFGEITASELRVNVKLQNNFSGGVLEIKVK